MALKAAQLKDLKKQTPEVAEKYLPDAEGKKKFLDAQIEGTQSMVYRAVTDLKLAENFAQLKGEQWNEHAINQFQENNAKLKAYLPSLDILLEERAALGK